MWKQLWIFSLIVAKVKWFALYHTNLFHEVPVSFVWLKFSSFGWEIDMRRTSSNNNLSLGMPRKASPLSPPTLSVTSLGAMFSFITWYVFCLERKFILLGFSCCYLELCFASFISIKVAMIAFAMLILQVYMLLFQNIKFIVVAKIP